jgi:guanylate kinase
LARRLKGRGTDSSDQVATRLKTAQEEVLDARDFQHVIVNESIDEAALAFAAILENRPSPAGLRHDHVAVLLTELSQEVCP